MLCQVWPQYLPVDRAARGAHPHAGSQSNRIHIPQLWTCHIFHIATRSCKNEEWTQLPIFDFDFVFMFKNLDPFLKMEQRISYPRTSKTQQKCRILF
jgi:hypothetical protein